MLLQARTALNFFEAALWIKSRSNESLSATRQGNDESKDRVRLSIERCLFADSERGLTLIGHFSDVIIADSVFSNHRAMHAGAGLLLLLNRGRWTRPAVIRNCSFYGNIAGLLSRSPIDDIGLGEGKHLRTIFDCSIRSSRFHGASIYQPAAFQCRNAQEVTVLVNRRSRPE